MGGSNSVVKGLINSETEEVGQGGGREMEMYIRLM